MDKKQKTAKENIQPTSTSNSNETPLPPAGQTCRNAQSLSQLVGWLYHIVQCLPSWAIHILRFASLVQTQTLSMHACMCVWMSATDKRIPMG
jgi:hypothetical protein